MTVCVRTTCPADARLVRVSLQPLERYVIWLDVVVDLLYLFILLLNAVNSKIVRIVNKVAFLNTKV